MQPYCDGIIAKTKEKQWKYILIAYMATLTNIKWYFYHIAGEDIWWQKNDHEMKQ